MPKIFAKMKHIDFCVPTKPHVDYKEGGHLFVEPSDKSISERIEMDGEQLIDMAYATQYWDTPCGLCCRGMESRFTA